MGKLVSVERLEDNRVKITIKSTPRTHNHYNILIRRGNICTLDKNIYGEESTYVKHYYNNDKQGRLHWHIHFPPEHEDAEYCVVFDNTQWVRENIKDIISQIQNQEKQILVNSALRRQTSGIAKAVKEDNYASLIKQMIREYSSTLTKQDICEIKESLDEVEQMIK